MQQVWIQPQIFMIDLASNPPKRHVNDRRKYEGCVFGAFRIENLQPIEIWVNDAMPELMSAIESFIFANFSLKNNIAKILFTVHEDYQNGKCGENF